MKFLIYAVSQKTSSQSRLIEQFVNFQFPDNRIPELPVSAILHSEKYKLKVAKRKKEFNSMLQYN